MMTDSPTPSTSRHHDDKCDKPEKPDKSVLLQIQDINSQVAQFRDLLINIGQPRDSPELREKIRKMRRNCVEACKHTSQLVLPHVQSDDEHVPVTYVTARVSRLTKATLLYIDGEKKRECKRGINEKNISPSHIGQGSTILNSGFKLVCNNERERERETFVRFLISLSPPLHVSHNTGQRDERLRSKNHDCGKNVTCSRTKHFQ
ncbi:uncharacterized protein LOC116850603 isoform X3 [Odontomachus brunneus]|uniref:uncharacterized protein LOC116850603 isoform X3 n=1 Tax=Odontomachus brunneus TaxID=486640 RepID=UPI0013F28935|nr:uncharacterized protein LOC116850603 isoform X3 [Odontomachus brunneus]